MCFVEFSNQRRDRSVYFENCCQYVHNLNDYRIIVNNKYTLHKTSIHLKLLTNAFIANDINCKHL